DILDFSKIEAGQIEFESIRFDLRVAVETVANSLATVAEGKGLEMICAIQPDIHSLVLGDPGRLRQILNNLTGNAIKFTTHGEICIEAKERKREDGNGEIMEVLFSITDTGIGIPEEKFGSVFEKFKQADGSTTREYGGTGLGLAISRQLVELMGGEIGVESNVGKGSRFWFTLPFKKQAEAVVDVQHPDLIENKKILIVDDIKINRELFINTLEKFRCFPDAVSSGGEAIIKLKEAAQEDKPFELVLMDIQMPEMNGYDAVKAIKADKEIACVPIIVLSSIGRKGQARTMKDIGCDGYISKPVRQSELFDAIITVLSHKKTEPGAKKESFVTRYSIAEQKYKDIRVLVVEDDPINKELAVNMLKKSGYTTYVANNGKKAVMAYERMDFDIILMDVQMPVMDGYDATRRIRKLESQRAAEPPASSLQKAGSPLRTGQHPEPGARQPVSRIPIIALTAHAMKRDEDKCLDAGMDDYLSKPLDPPKLLGVIEKWLDKVKKASGSVREEKEEAKKENAQPKTESDGLPIDIAQVLERAMGDKDFLKDLIEEFYTSLPDRVERLKNILKQKDAEGLMQEAHSLKGVAQNMNADGIADAAFCLEKMGHENDLTEAEQALDGLDAEVIRFKEYIDSIDY
ncbi:MAG: response regulator, partial [Desulfobulbaceae bacterium]|nr:response regulator [Desulfobulbaceae bacterium]